jgi:hypothetical protein
MKPAANLENVHRLEFPAVAARPPGEPVAHRVECVVRAPDRLMEDVAGRLASSRHATTLRNLDAATDLPLGSLESWPARH